MEVERFFIETDELQSRIHAKIENKGLVGIRGLGDLFRHAEEDPDQVFDIENDIPRVLGDIGVLINRTEITELLRNLDETGDGTIKLNDFVNFIAPPMNKERTDVVEKAFSKCDKNKSQTIEIDEIRTVSNFQSSAMVRLATKTNSPEALFQNLIKYYESEPSKQIPREEFFDYYRLISARIPTDREFISMIKQSWGVD